MNYTEIEVLRGIVKDELNVSTRTGIVDKVTDSYVNVRIGHATVLRKLKVIGDISYLVAGSNVIVLGISGTNYCLSSGVFSGGTALPAGANSYSLGSQYYDKTEIGDLLERKSDAGHSHRYDHLEAVSGTIGGFEILSDTIRSSVGDFALTSNINATRLVMGSGTDLAVMDGKHATYRFWAGDDVPADAPFSVEKDGKIHASAGDIAGWDILTDRLSKNNVELNPSGQITVGTGDDVAILGTTQGDWRLWIGDSDPAFAPFRVTKDGEVWLDSAHITFDLESDNYEAGVRGWKLDSTGWAELQDVVVRGRIEASVFAETTISAVSGQMVISIGDILITDLEATATTIQVSTNTLKIDDIIQFKASSTLVEWMRIETGSIPVTGGFQYGVERDLEGVGPSTLAAGTACVRKGNATDLRLAQPLASGEADGAFGALQPGGSGSASSGGWIVLDGEASSFSVITRQGPVWNQFQTTVKIGNLQGVLDYTLETWGMFIGDDNDYMAYDEVQGLRIQFVGSSYDTTISGSGFVTELAKLQKLSVTPDYDDGNLEMWFANEGGVLKLKARAKDGATESAFDITGVGVLSEVPNETPNGAVTVFSVDNPYTPGSLSVFVQGVCQRPGTDFTESSPAAGEFTMTTAPVTGVLMMTIYSTNTAVDFSSVPGGDHGDLGGLGDDDHGQYFLLAGETTNAEMHSGADFLVYSDAGSTLRIGLYGATGDMVITGEAKIGGATQSWAKFAVTGDNTYGRIGKALAGDRFDVWFNMDYVGATFTADQIDEGTAAITLWDDAGVGKISMYAQDAQSNPVSLALALEISDGQTIVNSVSTTDPANLILRSKAATQWYAPGAIKFVADDDASNETEYAQIYALMGAVTNGTEKGRLYWDLTDGGYFKTAMGLRGGGSAASYLTVMSDVNSDAAEIGGFTYYGKNDNATPETITYVGLAAKIIDASDGIEDGELLFNFTDVGTYSTQFKMSGRGLDILDRGGNPATPASGWGRLYVNGDELFFMDDAGDRTRISGRDSKNVTIGSGLDVIAIGDKMFFRLDEATRLERYTLMADDSGNLVVVLKKIAYADFGTTASWTTVATMTLSSAQKVEATTGWDLDADYVYKLEVTGTPATITLCGVELVMRFV